MQTPSSITIKRSLFDGSVKSIDFVLPLSSTNIAHAFEITSNFLLQSDETSVFEVVSCDALNIYGEYYRNRTFILHCSELSSNVTTRRRVAKENLFDDDDIEMLPEIELSGRQSIGNKRTSLVFKQPDIYDQIGTADSETLRNAYSRSKYKTVSAFCDDYRCDASNFRKWFKRERGSTASEAAVKQFLLDMLSKGETDYVLFMFDQSTDQ
jgi:hypothetical protein